MVLPIALFPAAVAAAPVVISEEGVVQVNEDVKVRSNCSVLMPIEPAENDTGSVTDAPGNADADPTVNEAVCANAPGHKYTLNTAVKMMVIKSALRAERCEQLRVLAVDICFSYLLFMGSS